MYTAAMEAIGQKIIRLRGERGMKPVDLARLAGISRQTLSSIETGVSDIPQSPTLAALARALQMTVAEFVADTTAQYQGETIISPIRGSTDGLLAPASFTMVAQGTQRPRGVVPTPYVIQMVPLVLQHIHAGVATVHDDPEFLPVAVPHNGRYLCMRVTGECMLPDIEPGDIVVLDQDMAVQPNWIAAIEVDGETRLTRMVRRDANEWQFAPDNPIFMGITVPANAVSIVGVVIARQKGPAVHPPPGRSVN